MSVERELLSTYVEGGHRSIVKFVRPAAGDTYKLANQVLIPPRFTPIRPHPAANTLIRPLILRDKSFRSSYNLSPFVVGIGHVSGPRPFHHVHVRDKGRFDRFLSLRN